MFTEFFPLLLPSTDKLIHKLIKRSGIMESLKNLWRRLRGAKKEEEPAEGAPGEGSPEEPKPSFFARLKTDIRDKVHRFREAKPVETTVYLRSGTEHYFKTPDLSENILHIDQGLSTFGTACKRTGRGTASALKAMGRGLAAVMVVTWNFVMPIRIAKDEQGQREVRMFVKPVAVERAISEYRLYQEQAWVRKERWEACKARWNEFIAPAKEHLPTEAIIVQKSGNVATVNRLTIERWRREMNMKLAAAFPALYGVKKQEVIDFSRNLATLLESGLPILQALQVLHRQSQKGRFRNILEKMMEDLEQGDTLSEACAKHPAAFEPFYTRLIRVGEETGNMEAVLRALVKQMQKDMALKAKLKSSMMYPSFIMLLGFGVILLLVMVLIPTMMDIYTANSMEPPSIVQLTVDVSDWIKANAIIILAAVIGAVILLAYYTSNTPSGIRAKDTFMMKAPVIGKVVLHGRLARMTNNMAILLGAGIPITEGFHLLIQSSDSVLMKESLTEVNKQIHTGESLSAAMQTQPLFPILLTQMVEVGEMTGRLETNLEIVGTYYEEETDKSTSRMVSVIGPGMMLVVGGIIGGVMALMFSSIYGIYGSLDA
jgi:type IV pilus assembly protein PilC